MNLTLNLTITDNELAVLILALRELERNLRQGELADSPLKQAEAVRLQGRLRDLSRVDDIPVQGARDLARGLRQMFTLQGVEQVGGTEVSRKWGNQCSTLKNTDLRTEVGYILEQARLNADQTIIDESAANPARWNAIFIGSVEVILSQRSRWSAATRRWFLRRGVAG